MSGIKVPSGMIQELMDVHSVKSETKTNWLKSKITLSTLILQDDFEFLSSRNQQETGWESLFIFSIKK